MATLTADNHVLYRTIQISRDMGNSVEVAAGLSPSDRIIDSPPDALEDGDLVKVAAPVAAPAAPTSGAAKS